MNELTEIYRFKGGGRLTVYNTNSTANCNKFLFQPVSIYSPFLKKSDLLQLNKCFLSSYVQQKVKRPSHIDRYIA